MFLKRIKSKEGKKRTYSIGRWSSPSGRRGDRVTRLSPIWASCERAGRASGPTLLGNPQFMR